MYKIITKRKAYIVPVLFAVLFLIVSLVGCASLDAPDQSDGEVAENAVNTDCPLCGDNGEISFPLLSDKDNIALVSLSSFDVQLIGINQFDADGKLREEYDGVVSLNKAQTGRMR